MVSVKDKALNMAIEYIESQEIKLSFDNLKEKQHTLQACKDALEQHQEEVPKGVLQAIDKYGLSLLKTAHGFELRKLGKTEASSIVEQPAQEPVAFCKHGVPKGVCRLGEKDCNPAPPWHELSEVEINALADFWNISDIDIKEFIKKIERMSREMNT